MRELTRHHHDGYNYTDSITTSVTIRVTPGPDDFLVSWTILWAAFVILSMVATWQVIKENRLLASRRQAEDRAGSGGDGEEKASARECAEYGTYLWQGINSTVYVIVSHLWLPFSSQFSSSTCRSIA
jgi:hypothetical protein